MKLEDKITHITISTQVLSFHLANLKSEGYFKQSLAKTASNFINQLKIVEWSWYDKFFKSGEDSTIVVYETYDNFLKTVANVPIWEMDNITRILQAYQKSPESIEGIVKNILK
jgi:hypothetical protein